MRITPEGIKKLKPEDIFVFGSNESGIHGAGAARLAYDQFEARLGQGFGPSGQTFAIPTKDWDIKTLPLADIHGYVDRFISFAERKEYQNYRFFVTQIGCGLAGYTPRQIAPMFKECLEMSNIWLPEPFLSELGYGKYIDTRRTGVSHDTTDRDREGNVAGF